MHLSAFLHAGTPAATVLAARHAPLIVTSPGRWPLNGNGVAAKDRHIVVTLDCTCATPPPPLDRMSLRTMRRGAELVTRSCRQVVVDEDAYLLIEGHHDRRSLYVGNDVVSPLCVVFGAGSFEQALARPDADSAEAGATRHTEWLESLQPLAGQVHHHLQQIEHHARMGWLDPLWWDERILLLLACAVDAEQALQAREARVAALKPATRRELLRRVLMASDFMQSTYAQPIDLGDIATAAHLSRFHLVRLFRDVHGVTPYAFLLRKRLQVALRLLAQTRMGLDDIAARTGLGTRSSLFRHLRRTQGRSAAALRACLLPQGA